MKEILLLGGIAYFLYKIYQSRGNWEGNKIITLYPSDYILDDHPAMRVGILQEFSKDIPPKWITQLYEECQGNLEVLLPKLERVRKVLYSELDRHGNAAASEGTLDAIKKAALLA